MKPSPHVPHLSGILRQIGHELDLDPEIAFCALVDRAHDACQRLLVQRPSFVPAILVGTQTIGGIAHVSICDNGAPLAPDEVRNVYSLGRDGRAKLAEGSGDVVVGRLGMALLAAFAISDQISISTRAHDQPPDGGMRFLCTSRAYHCEPYRLARPGTIIQLRLRRECQMFGDVTSVRDALLPHARTLALPVRVGTDPHPINC
jgi:HSP90 family molecular chaperone